jgi:peptide/nickel transport system substrate-binding protein
MLKNKKVMLALALITIASTLLAACQPQTVTVEVTKEVVKEATVVQEQQVVVTATPVPATQSDTIIIGAWQQPRSFLSYANSQAIRVEIELVYRPRFVVRSNFGYQPNPVLIDGDLPSFENGGAVLNDVTVKAGEPIFSTETFVVEAAKEDTQAKQLVVTGKIKAGLKWSDGQPLTANDLLLAWQKSCEKDSGSLDLTTCPFGSVEGASGLLSKVEAPDDTTVVVSYVPGALDPAYFLQPFDPCSNSCILPSHLFKDMAAADIAADERATGSENALPLAYGPYQMKEWKIGDRIVFEPNPNWSGPAPKTPNIIYRFFADSTSLAAAAIAGDIDSTSAITGLAVDQAPYMESVAKTGAITYTTDPNAASFEMLYINYYDPADKTLKTLHPVVGDYNVRKAISMALNRQQMVDTIYYGQSAVVEQPQLPQMISYDPSLGTIAYDPEGAKKLLEDSGWKDSDGDGIREKDGVKASINYLTTSGNAPRQKAAQVLQASLKDIGIEVATTFQPSSVTFSTDGLYGRNFNLIQFANVFSVVDPGTWLYGVANCTQIPTPENGYAGSNFAGWCQPEASDAAVHAAYLTLDEKERKADWAVVIKKYFEPGADPMDPAGGYPVIPLYTRPNYLATAPGLEGAKLDGTEYFTWNIETWTLSIAE